MSSLKPLLLALVFTTSAIAAQVDTLDVVSTGMNKTLRAAVVLPAAYRKSKVRFPVLYLLHGGGGSFRDWLTNPPNKTLLHQLADQYNLIIVTPDGGPNSYYFDSPLDKSSQYETFIAQELPQRIDAAYRTIQDRSGRVIAGLSMGGHGAMYIAALHPDRYCAAGSMSGVMNLNTALWKTDQTRVQARARRFVELLGPPKDTLSPYFEYSIISLTNRLKTNKLPLIFDIGVDDFLIDINRDLHRRLLANGTPHDYTERPGGHTWPYWQNALPYQLLFFRNVLRQNGTLVEK